MYYLGIAASLALQVFLIIHVFRNGKDRFWIYLIFFVPLAGSLAYFFLEVLPDLRHSRTVNVTGRAINRIVNPNGRIRELENQLAACNTVANKVALANALLDNGDSQRAIDLLENAREGIYKDDPKIVTSLARAYYQARQYDRVIENYQGILKNNENLMSGRDWLHLALSHQETGNVPEAESNFHKAIAKSGGFEIKYRLGTLLMKNGRKAEGYTLFKEILNQSRTLPRHVVRQEQAWIKLAEQDLNAQ